MGLRENFQKLIEKKQDEIRELEVRIREAQAYLQALQDSARLIPKDEYKPIVISSDNTLRAGTALAKTRELLLEAGEPLHVNDILNRMGKIVDQATRVSLVGTLGSYARKGRVFSRTGPNIFGLIEFRVGEKKEKKDLQPELIPNDFGKF